MLEMEEKIIEILKSKSISFIASEMILSESDFEDAAKEILKSLKIKTFKEVNEDDLQEDTNIGEYAVYRLFYKNNL